MATKVTIEASGQCYFDLLLSKNVPHILEKIFFSLDFESFNNCLRVNNTWKKQLNSQSFPKKARYVFQKEIFEYEHMLCMAAMKGEVAVVRSLLSNPMLDVDHWCGLHSIDSIGALSIAAANGHTEVVELLLDGGADPNKASPKDQTPLHVVTAIGYPRIVKLLIDRGAKVNNADENGATPLHVAASLGNWRMYKLLVDRGANQLQKDNDGREPLKWRYHSPVPSPQSH